jgi:hypothetical protein
MSGLGLATGAKRFVNAFGRGLDPASADEITGPGRTGGVGHAWPGGRLYAATHIMY